MNQVNQVRQQHNNFDFSLSNGPLLKRQKLADTNAATTLLKNEKRIQSSYQMSTYDFVSPATTQQISFWQGLLSEWNEIKWNESVKLGRVSWGILSSNYLLVVVL